MSEPKTHPAIFELDEDNEATGLFYLYCSEDCAIQDPSTIDFDFPRYSIGEAESPDFDYHCCKCGKPLEA